MATVCVAEGGRWISVGAVVVASVGSLDAGGLLLRSCDACAAAVEAGSICAEAASKGPTILAEPALGEGVARVDNARPTSPEKAGSGKTAAATDTGLGAIVEGFPASDLSSEGGHR